jgi:valacyclovir hydrolase
VGTSGGAVIALWLAILYPRRVQAVVADSVTERFTAAMFDRNVAAGRAQRTPGQIAFWQHAHGPDWEAVIEADTDMLRRLAARDGAWFAGRLPEVRCPVLLTASREDAMLGDPGRQLCALAAQIAGSRAYLHPTGDHPLMCSQPRAFRRLCDVFLAGDLDVVPR